MYADAGSPHRGGTVILVVEDDYGVRMTVAAMLEAAGCTVITACDGRGGLIAAEHDRPDIVLTDLIMPELDGIGFILSLRRARPSVRIVAMSGAWNGRDAEYLSFATKLGADAILAKPFSADELTAALAWALRRHCQVA